MTPIHSSSVVDPSAVIHPDAEIGPFCHIGPQVEIGSGTRLVSHVSVTGPTRIGQGNIFYPHSSIGQRSQDLKYTAEPTYLEIGDTIPSVSFVRSTGAPFLERRPASDPMVTFSPTRISPTIAPLVITLFSLTTGLLPDT